MKATLISGTKPIAAAVFGAATADGPVFLEGTAP
jgi:hypothetical protein